METGRSNLRDAVMTAGWATPAAHEAGGTPEAFLQRKERAAAAGSSIGVSLTSLSLQAQTAGWSTPTVHDATGAKTPEQIAAMRIRAPKRPGGGPPGVSNLNEQVQQVDFGTPATGFPAETHNAVSSGGQLNPEHSRWLMGLPAAWARCAPTGMRSSGRKRPSSSKRR